MANETLLNRKFLPSVASSSRKALGILADLVRDEGATQMLKSTFDPNFQHDVESIWWLLIYTATARVDHQLSNEFSRKVFLPTMELGSYRLVCLINTIKDDLV